MRQRVGFALYYSTWPVLFGWNPTKLCNRLVGAQFDGHRYDTFGGARWHQVYNPLTDQGISAEVITPEEERVSTEA